MARSPSPTIASHRQPSSSRPLLDLRADTDRCLVHMSYVSLSFVLILSDSQFGPSSLTGSSILPDCEPRSRCCCGGTSRPCRQRSSVADIARPAFPVSSNPPTSFLPLKTSIFDRACVFAPVAAQKHSPSLASSVRSRCRHLRDGALFVSAALLPH